MTLVRTVGIQFRWPSVACDAQLDLPAHAVSVDSLNSECHAHIDDLALIEQPCREYAVSESFDRSHQRDLGDDAVTFLDALVD